MDSLFKVWIASERFLSRNPSRHGTAIEIECRSPNCATYRMRVTESVVIEPPHLITTIRPLVYVIHLGEFFCAVRHFCAFCANHALAQGNSCSLLEVRWDRGAIEQCERRRGCHSDAEEFAAAVKFAPGFRKVVGLTPACDIVAETLGAARLEILAIANARTLTPLNANLPNG